jgi:hypothetical protein
MYLHSILVAYYNVRIEEEMIHRAIKTSKFDFLYTVFAYKKNYLEDKQKWLSYNELVTKVIDICEDQATSRCRDIANWKLPIPENENFLQALLNNGMDQVAW